MQILIAKDGKQSGPYTEAQAREMMASGALSPTDLAWHEGMTGWMPLQSVLGAAVSAPAGAIAPGMTSAIDQPALAERGTRLGAVLIDTLIALVCSAPGIITIAVADGDDTGTTIGVILCVLAGLGLGIVQLYLLSTRGQTIGKKVMKVKVVKFEDNSNPGFVGAALLRVIVPALIGAVPFVGGLFSIVDICFIFADDRRCLHDKIAGTKVVKA